MGLKRSCCSLTTEDRQTFQWLCNFSCSQTLMSD